MNFLYVCMYVCMYVWTGISGGQMKRLSIGVEIVGLPGNTIYFVDMYCICMYVYVCLLFVYPKKDYIF